MSRLADLIAQLCPDGVEYRALGEMGSLFGGLSGKTKSDFTEVDGACPFVTYKEVYSLLEINQIPQGRVLVSSREKQLVLQRGDVLFTGSSENADEVGLTAVVTVGFSEPVYLNSFSICLRWYEHAFEPGYTKYLFASPSVRAQIRRCANGVTRFNLSKKRLEGVRVPVPPLEVQREIVKILDQFTTLEAELEAELEARRTQYEYYRNQLLSYDALASRGPVEWVKLGEVASKIITGVTPKAADPKYYQDATNPWIRTQDVNFCRINEASVFVTDQAITELPLKWVSPHSVVVAISGASAGRSAILNIRAVTNQHCCNIEINSKLADFRYVYYCIASCYEQLRNLGRGARGDLNVSIIKSFEIPLPTLDEQRYIADILDRFDALVNDISSGLPAEIAARRAQYEYYRDRMLSFPEKK